MPHFPVGQVKLVIIANRWRRDRMENLQSVFESGKYEFHMPIRWLARRASLQRSVGWIVQDSIVGLYYPVAVDMSMNFLSIYSISNYLWYNVIKI